jgi:hypothetical protein
MNFKKLFFILLCFSFVLLSLSIINPAFSQTCTDADGDGYGVNGDPSCTGIGEDCDDNDDTVHPGAQKICDGKDNNCDGKKDFTTDVDVDGDGVPWCASDCNDNNDQVYPGNIEGPYGDPKCTDGLDNNCNGIPESQEPLCLNPCIDVDGDNYGLNGHPLCPLSGVDCDDNNAARNPGAVDDTCDGFSDDCDGPIDEDYVPDTSCGTGECGFPNNTPSICDVGGIETACQPGPAVAEDTPGTGLCIDGLDNDCDGEVDNPTGTCYVNEPDIDDDGDGYCEAGCTDGSTPGDCDDNNAARNPGVLDVTCDNFSDDCDGPIDEDYVPDASCGTGECNTNNTPSSCDTPSSCGAGGNETACQPGPSVPEDTPGVGLCIDGLDNDCDGIVDNPDTCIDNPPDIDDDGDGYCEGPTCSDGSTPGDCDDTDPAVHPGALKICDGKDNNCDGKKDFTTDEDKDLDGVPWCAADCDDNNDQMYPGNIEGPYGDPKCTDGLDNNCNGIPESQEPLCLDPCKDLDGDGYYAIDSDPACSLPRDDCDDNNADRNPGVALDSTCDGFSDDCDGPIDEDSVPDTSCGAGECGFPNNTPSICDIGGIETACQPGPAVPEDTPGTGVCIDGLDNDCDGEVDNPTGTCYVNDPDIDDDGDGYCEAGCTDGSIPGDCDDSNTAVNPAGDDANCNGIDEDCDGPIDDDYVPDTSCGTGECGFPNNTPSSCIGGVETACIEGLPTPEDTPFVGVCIDGLDNDCDGSVDENDLDCFDPCADDDSDGYCQGGPSCGSSCIPGDCDPLDPNVFPGAPKICDGKDSNCDGKKDFASDEDKDSDGVPVCVHWQTGLSDCDDTNDQVYPGSTEGPYGDITCSDGLDNNCNGAADIADAVCVPPSCDTITTQRSGPHSEIMMAPGPDGLPNTADDVVHPENNNLLCGKCHGTDFLDPIRSACDRCHTAGGTTKALYPDLWPFGFASAQDVQVHSSTTVGTQYGTWDMDCVTCHNPHKQEQDDKHGTTYGKLIKEYICFDNTAIGGGNFEEIVEFTAASGAGSFADGPPNNENICEMCHTQTDYHRNDGLAPGDWDGVPGSSAYLGHNDGDPCTACHLHADGFKPGAAGQSHDTHLNSLKGPNLDCETGCHGTNSPPMFADGNDLANTTVCDNCHSPGGSFDGVNAAVTGAKTNWTDGVYVGRTLAVGKEMWCAGCHDDAPSNSMIDGTGVSAGNITGDNTTVGFYITGHGNNPGVTCIQCHDASKKHIDHAFSPAEDVVKVLGNPTNYRFYDGKGMSLPHTLSPAPVLDDFRLCFTCHDETWFTSANMTTNFRVENPPFSTWLDSYNLHYFHLFSYGNTSVTNCVLCHNPHGTNRPMMTDVAFTGKFSVLTLDAGLGKYIELIDPADWHNPALNAGGVITQNGACFTCHFNVPSEPTLAAGLGPAEGAEDGWYLRSYNVPSYTVNFDVDGDGISDAEDNCSGVINDQTDSDGDGIGDACDNCVNNANAVQIDTDNDGIGNVCDPSCDTSVLDWRFQFGADTDVGGILSDEASALTIDNNGNIYVTGKAAGNFTGSSTPDYSNGADVFLRKFDPDGNALWTEKAASPLNDDIASDVALDSNGNIYVTGHTKGSFPNNTNQAEGVTYDIFVVKFAPDKTISWIKELGTAQDDKAYAMAINSNDDIYVVGTTNGDLCGTLNGTSDYFLMKFDSSGNSFCVDQFGSSGTDDARDVEVDSTGNLYVVVGSNGAFPGFTHLGNLDSYVVKYDQAGSRQWIKQIATVDIDNASGVDIGTDDSVYVAGTTTGSLTAQQNPGSNEVFLIKYDAGGIPLWTTQRSGHVYSVKRIAVDPVGNSYITGIISASLDGMDFHGSVDIFLVKFEAAGNSAWAKSWGGLWSDHSFDIALDNTGNHYITGWTEYEFPPNANLGGYDAILLKGSEVCP